MYISLIQNVALLIALSAFYNLIARWRKDGQLLIRIILGFLFGGVAVAGMEMPFRYSPGIIFDGRSIVLSLAGLFGGWTAGGIAAGIAALYRFSLGGTGAFVGAGVAITSVAIGAVWRKFLKDAPEKATILSLFALGILVHTAMLIWMLALPWPTGIGVIKRIGVPVMLIFPVATVLIGTFIGTEERRILAERKMRESEERFRLAFQTSPDAVNINRLSDGLYVDVNDGFTELTGFTREEVIGKTSLEIDIWAFPADRERLVARLKETGVVNNMEALFRMKDGRLLTGLMSARVIELNGEPHILSITRNIESIKEAERELRRRQFLLEKSQSIGRVGSWEYDIVADKLTWSDEVYRIFGVNPEEFGANYDAFFEYVHPDDRATVHEAYQKSLREGADGYEIQHRIIRRNDGEVRTVFERCEHIKDESGKIVRSIGFVQDVTEQMATEEELRRLTEELELRVAQRTAELEEANHSLEAFVYSVSHDLRTPLRAITGFAEIISRHHRDNLDEKGQHYLDNILEAANRMNGLISDLLKYSRLGRNVMPPTAVALTPLVADVVSDLESLRAEMDAEIIIEPDMPVVRGVPVLLRQAFANLIENALKYCKEDVRPRVEITADRRENWVIVRVSDNGIGIAPEYQHKIFDIFQRLHSRDDYPGTGIGLSIVKKAVELEGGTVGVESVPGQGSTFWLKLPASESMNENGEKQ